MAYRDIDNLYKNQDILMFNECYALEKIHGTSAHVSFKVDGSIGFFAGGCSHTEFLKLFNEEQLKTRYNETIIPPAQVIVYGEAYGSKLMKMRATYGDSLRFVAFEVKIGDCWLNVPNAAQVALGLGFEFVHFERIPATIEAINKQRDAPSVQAKRNGITEDKPREGIVLHPIEEFTKNNGNRIIAKHKRDEFMETSTPREVSPERLRLLKEAKAIAEEWVTPMRLVHVADKAHLEIAVGNIGRIIPLMTEDILKESISEIMDSQDARKEIGRQTALLVKRQAQHTLV